MGEVSLSTLDSGAMIFPGSRMPALLQTAAREAYASRFDGREPEELHLIQVVDKPGTDEDQAVFDVSAGGDRHRVVLGRRDGDWVAAA